MKASFQQTLKPRQVLAPKMRLGLKLLSKDIAELREELYRELAQNPVLEDVEQTISPHTTSEVERAGAAVESSSQSDWPDEDFDSVQSYFSADADSLERREHFFDSQTRPETLEEHLRNQIGLTDLNAKDRQIAEFLVGSLDHDGRFIGSLADIQMATGANEEHLRRIIDTIKTLDPPGCGATSLQECLLAQLDKLGDSPYREDVAELISNHLGDLAKRDYAAITAATGMSDERIDDCLELIRTLEPHPGRAYADTTSSAAYVHPEIHAVREGGRWVAHVDERDLPEIHISKRYLAMLENPSTPADVREYIRAKIDAIEEIREAISHRFDTIRSIAQAIFDAQPDFFERGLAALHPLTMSEIATRVGIHHSTVSRTVNGKYASTPFGTIELRAFFIAGIAAEDGTSVTTSQVENRLKELIDAEDKSAPLSDERLAQLLTAEGYRVARRTVAKYRTRLGIPAAPARGGKADAVERT